MLGVVINQAGPPALRSALVTVIYRTMARDEEDPNRPIIRSGRRAIISRVRHVISNNLRGTSQTRTGLLTNLIRILRTDILFPEFCRE